MFSCRVEPETPSINCSCFNLLHAISPSCTWNGFFSLTKLCPIVHWSFGKILVHWVCRSSEGWHISLYNIKKKKKFMLVKISTHPLSSEVPGSCQAPGGWYKGSKIPIFTWKLEFYHQQILPVAFLEVTGSLRFLLRKCLANTRVWRAPACLSVILWRQNAVPRKKQLVQLWTEMMARRNETKCFSWDDAHSGVDSGNGLYTWPRVEKRCVHEGQD